VRLGFDVFLENTLSSAHGLDRQLLIGQLRTRPTPAHNEHRSNLSVQSKLEAEVLRATRKPQREQPSKR
jgi:hypothetical protein